MENEFVTLQKFQDLQLAEATIVLLKENNIEFILEDESPKSDSVLRNNPLANEYRIKILQTDFDKANELLTVNAKQEMNAIDKDHYLFEFTDDELMEIVTKPDEWNKSDYLLAAKILKDRGKEINPDLLTLLKKQRIEELTKTEPSQKTWIIAGYIFALMGGLLGLFIGRHLSTFKKTLPNGEKVFAYNEQDRKNGNRIFIISIFTFPIYVILEIVIKISN